MKGPRLFDDADWKSRKRSSLSQMSCFPLKIMLPMPNLDGRFPKKKGGFCCLR